MEKAAAVLDDKKVVAMKRLALVGNPNVGKSVVFNRLTGQYVTVSNYPGTTVDVSRGGGRLGGENYEIVDTPGVNSLIPNSEDERVTRDLLLRENPDVLVQVADAKNLHRALLLTLELAEFRRPMLLVLNMMDEAMSRGLVIDPARLSRRLGIPVLRTVATLGEGLADVKAAVARAAVPSAAVPYPPEIHRSLEALDGAWRTDFSPKRAVSLALLSGDGSALTWAHPGLRPGETEESLWRRADAQRAAFVRPPRLVVFEARDGWVKETLGEAVYRRAGPSGNWASRFGNWCMRPWPGYLIALAALYAVYQFVGVFGAGVAVDFLEGTVFGRYIVPAAQRLADLLLPSTFLRDMVVGPYGIVTMALTYAFALIFPIVTTFFLAFGILEDSGYLPRLSVMMDRLFRLMGLNGRAVLPMVLGLGCDSMATVTTRVLDTAKERLIVTVLLSLSVPCSAQLAVILGMTAGMSPRVFLLWLGVVAGITFVVGWGSARFLPGARSTFVMEIPPLRRPMLRNLLLKIKARLEWYLKEVVPLFVLGTLVLFFLDKFGGLKRLEVLGAPVVQKFLGLPAAATQTFLIGFLRRDYGAAGLYHLQMEGLMNDRQVTVSLVLITLFMPCIAQWLMVVKERGWKMAAVVTAVVTVIALAAAGGLNALLSVAPRLISS
ncbi:MAG TPA: ferrous iron transport protein B [Elusimicrobiota bacterium]|nr:ferrous iron transport protein B [Elusimicrobiota bacterium]